MLALSLLGGCARGGSVISQGVDAAVGGDLDAGLAVDAALVVDAALPLDDASVALDAGSLPLADAGPMPAIDAGTRDAGPPDTGTVDAGPSCATGMTDCNGSATDGCETSTTSNAVHCGACGVVCPAIDGTPSCVAGRCLRETLLDSEDAYVDNTRPSAALGGAGELLVDEFPGRYEALLRPRAWDATIPAGAVIVSARLEIQCFDGGDDVDLHEVAAPWMEGTVTWSTRPARGAKFGQLNPGSGRHALDVTTAAMRWPGGSVANGVYLIPTGENGSDYRSREYGNAAERPRFIVRYRF